MEQNPQMGQWLCKQSQWIVHLNIDEYLDDKVSVGMLVV